ncbi:MAG: Uma2 family endonuclease [Clostridia bacterium]|nr:Uma2 family endonuclease [Deltaproteobacteria bacterium]
MSPSIKHEEVKKLLARLVETYADVRGINLYGRGSMTTKAPELERGAEPDECYVLNRQETKHDLVIEVVFTSGSINKLELYRGLGANEVWFWIDEALDMYVLEPAGYRRVMTSAIFPELDIGLFERFARSDDQARAVREFRRALG